MNGTRIARVDTSNNVLYYISDHLGSSRIVANSSGTILDDSDFYPYGGELPIISSSGNTYKFTGKERDTESSLDYLSARYYGSAMGRFSSPDPFNIIMRATTREHFDTYLGQPQNWNMYAYTWNNPLRFTDPTGETVYVVTYTTGNQEGDEDFKKAAESRASDIRNTKGFDSSKDTVLVAGVSSFKQFADVISQANGMEKQFGKVGEVDLFSHAGDKNGPNFNYGLNPAGQHIWTNEQNMSGLLSLTINWGQNATAGFYGCNTARSTLGSANFAQQFANRQGVATEGFTTTTWFSSSAYQYRPLFMGDHEYMIHRDGGVPVRRNPEGSSQ